MERVKEKAERRVRQKRGLRRESYKEKMKERKR